MRTRNRDSYKKRKQTERETQTARVGVRFVSLFQPTAKAAVVEVLFNKISGRTREIIQAYDNNRYVKRISFTFCVLHNALLSDDAKNSLRKSRRKS